MVRGKSVGFENMYFIRNPNKIASGLNSRKDGLIGKQQKVPERDFHCSDVTNPSCPQSLDPNFCISPPKYEVRKNKKYHVNGSIDN